MQGEVDTSDQLLLLEIVQLIHVVSIEDFYEEFLIFLESEGDIDRLNKFGVQVIEYDLGLPLLLPLVAFEFPENAEWISF